jgi:hypothetical protein
MDNLKNEMDNLKNKSDNNNGLIQVRQIQDTGKEKNI